MIANRKKTCLAAAVIVAVTSLGCSRTEHEIPDVAPPQPSELYQPFVGGTGLQDKLLDRPPYRLRPADILEIIYQVKNIVTGEPYELKIEDVIKIAFPYQPDLDQELTLAGDGRIRCLLVGEVRAAGRTAEELEDMLKQMYARYIKQPEMTVVVEAANKKIEELKKAITTAPRGQSRLIPVKPDGTIDLPYIGETLVAGKTVDEAKMMLDQKYVEADLQEVEVTVQTLHFAPRHIYVMGEVFRPDHYETWYPVTLTQALIHAGGPNVRGDKKRILLIRRQYLPIPQAIVFDLETLLNAKKPTEFGQTADGSKFRYDMYLEDGDIVYVPPTDLAQATDWIDQVFTKGVRAGLPYSANVGVNFGYEIHNAPTPVQNAFRGPPQLNTQLGP